MQDTVLEAAEAKAKSDVVSHLEVTVQQEESDARGTCLIIVGGRNE